MYQTRSFNAAQSQSQTQAQNAINVPFRNYIYSFLSPASRITQPSITSKVQGSTISTSQNANWITMSSHYPYSPHSPRYPAVHARWCRPCWRCVGGRSATRLPSASWCAGAWCACRRRGRIGRRRGRGRGRSLGVRVGGFGGGRLIGWTF